MGLSFDEAKLLGIGHLFPSPRSDEAIIRELAGEQMPPPAKEAGDGMNKTERAFYDMVMVSPMIIKIRREPLNFRLAGRTWYRPDFGVWTRGQFSEGDRRFTLVEIKGWMRDDAAVKIKVAAELYPEWRWLLVHRNGRHEWNVRNVTRTGISRESIQIPWIKGGGG